MLNSMLPDGLGFRAAVFTPGLMAVKPALDRASGGTPISLLLSPGTRCRSTPDVLYTTISNLQISGLDWSMSVYMSVYMSLRLSLYGLAAPNTRPSPARHVRTRVHAALTRVGAIPGSSTHSAGELRPIDRARISNHALVASNLPVVG